MLNSEANYYSGIGSDQLLSKLLERFKRTRRPINVSFRKLVPDVNGTDRATHLIHTYPAKLLVHIPIFFLHNDILSKPGDTVLDPFCGSGTVLLEAMLADRKAVGIDVNPLASLITRAKTTPIDPRLLRKALSRVNSRVSKEKIAGYPDVTNLDYWFNASVKRQLSKLKSAIDRTRSTEVRDFLMVCLSQCIKKVCLADPRFAVPVRLKRNKYPKNHPLRARLNDHLDSLKSLKVRNIFGRIVEVNISRMEKLHSLIDHLPPSTTVLDDIRYFCNGTGNGDSPSKSIMRDGTVDIVITSPPYPGSQKYIRASSLSLGWLDLCDTSEIPRLKGTVIGREETRANGSLRPAASGIGKADRFISHIWKHNKNRAQIAATYVEEMTSAIEVIYRVLKKRGYLVIIVGDGHFIGERFPNHEIVQEMCEMTGFKTMLILKDAIKYRSLQTKRHPTSRVMQDEWILLLRK